MNTQKMTKTAMSIAEANDMPTIGSPFAGRTTIGITVDEDREQPRVHLHAHKGGIGGLFALKIGEARDLAAQLTAAADALERALDATPATANPLKR